MDDFQNDLEQKLQNPIFREEFDKLQVQREYISALIETRLEAGLTQKELAEKTGLRQSNISRIENGTCSPTLATLDKIARGMGKKLHITFRTPDQS